MSERKDYARKREVELAPVGGRAHYAELRFDPLRGPVTDCCVGYKVWYGGEYAEIVRYDSAHDEFHRHKEGYPAPGEIVEWFPAVPMNRRGSFAVANITANHEAWQAVLPIPMEARKEDKPS